MSGQVLGIAICVMGADVCFLQGPPPPMPSVTGDQGQHLRAQEPRGGK